jgi:hypothetical protein
MRIATGALIAALLAATALVLMPGAGAASADRGATASLAGEPDRDGDGYGDETEDGCPWNAAVQVECPPVTVKVRSTTVTAGAIVVKLGVSSEAQVQAFGQVSWQVSEGHGRKHGLTVGLSAGEPRTVLPATVASFRVPLTKAVLRRLGRISPRKALRARMSVRVTDLAGRENDRVLTVKLRGREH